MGAFSGLRKALEDKRMPSHYYGPISCLDDIFLRLSRLHEIVIVLHAYQHDVRETARSVGGDAMYRDLERLESEFKAAIFFLTEAINKVRGVREAL